MTYWHSYPNRTMCQVLEELRMLDKSKNYGPMLGLIEEIQSMANRMEAGLHDKKDYEQMLQAKKELKKELKELELKKERLNE